MTRARTDGRFFLVLGIVTFILFGAFLKYRAADSMVDFKSVYYASRALIQHRDPYNQKEFSGLLRTRFGESRFIEHHESLGISVNLPTTYFLLAPFASLSFRIASELWSLLTATTLIFAACTIWWTGRDSAPVITGALVGFALANCAVVVANGNTAGLVAGLCIIAVWCFIARRVIWLGVLCFAVSLVVKPQDAGVLWLFFLLTGGLARRRALQAVIVAILLALPAAFWVSRSAPQWIPELHSNLVGISARGGNCDPGPDGLTSKSGTMEVITDLQTVVSVFRDSPSFYNTTTILICAALLILLLIAALRSGYSPTLAWTAMAAIAPLTLLVTYHRAYDARLLLLAIPACAMLWARGGAAGKTAAGVTSAAMFFTGEIPLAFLNPLLMRMHLSTGSLMGKIGTVLLMRLGSLSLLVMCLFFLWLCWRQQRAESVAPVVANREPASAGRV